MVEPTKKKNKRKKKKVAPAYFPQAFLVWKSVYDKVDSLKPSSLLAPSFGCGSVAKLKGAYVPEAVMSKLFSGKGKAKNLNRYFLNLENHKISALVPELVLYRIEEGRKPKPFYFPTTSKYNLTPEGNNFNYEESYSAGAAAITSFSITLAGKNPYEASRKFLTAKLDVKVDNISVLFNAPQGYANLADLFVIRTSGASTDAAGKTFSAADFQDSRNCRIGAILGYSVPRTGLFEQQEITTIESSRQLVNLFYSGHSLNLEKDGSATISINYTGYLESSNGSLSNLVASPKSKAGLQRKVSQSERISADIRTFFGSEGQEEESGEEESVDPFQVQASKDFAETPQQAKKREEKEKDAEEPETDHEDIIVAFREIVAFLYENGKIYSTKFSDDFFRKRYKTVSNQRPGDEANKLLSGLDLIPGQNAGAIVNQDRIHYFNFGDFLQAYFYKVNQDLLEVSNYLGRQANKLLDKETSSVEEMPAEPILKDKDQAAKLMREIKKLNILTSNFSGMRNESKKHSPSFIKNIADIPVSVDTLYSLVYESIGKPQFRFYGMYEFLSDFCVKLLNNSFDKFQGADLIRDLTFKLTTFSARDLSGRITDGTVAIEDVPSPIESFSKNSIEASSEYLLFHQESTQYGRSPGTGDTGKDALEGIFHLKTSKNKGLLKTITFSKIAMAQREAYLVARAGDLYDELRLPHNATAEMFGNSLFLPSSFVYIDPDSLGFGSVKDKNSAARRLGFGGYYTVESVSTTFSGGTLTTTLNLLFNAFPDTVGQPKLKTENEADQLKDISKVTNLLK